MTLQRRFLDEVGLAQDQGIPLQTAFHLSLVKMPSGIRPEIRARRPAEGVPKMKKSRHPPRVVGTLGVIHNVEKVDDHPGRPVQVIVGGRV
jgi:hypothetical protein